MKRLVLIDGHAILYRAYHAFPQSLTTRKGELINAVYGFARMLLKVIEDLKPAYIAVAFDLPAPTFRHREFIGYQAQRPKMETALGDQIERVYQIVQTLNIPVFTAEGYEADDIIGTLANQAAQKKIMTIIVTGDKDIMQLVGPKIKIYAPIKGFSQAKLFDVKAVKEFLGVKPEQIIDYKALVGDPSDNYPGVPGIGPKTAVGLLSEFKSLKGIYKKLLLDQPKKPLSQSDQNKNIRPAVIKKLKEGRESAELSRRLAEIITNAPVKLNLKACRVHDYDRQKAQALFEQLEFKSLINKLPKAEGGKYKIQKPERAKKDKQMKLL